MSMSAVALRPMISRVSSYDLRQAIPMAPSNHDKDSAADAGNNGNAAENSTQSNNRAEELRAFVGLSVFLAPVLTAALVAVLGFAIWLSQMVFGPPGPQG